MIFANLMSLERKLIDKETVDYINNELLKPNIPMKLEKKFFNKEILLSSMKNDKKRTGKYLTVVIPVKKEDDIKFTKINDVKDGEFYKILNKTIDTLFNE